MDTTDLAKRMKKYEGSLKRNTYDENACYS